MSLGTAAEGLRRPAIGRNCHDTASSEAGQAVDGAGGRAYDAEVGIEAVASAQGVGDENCVGVGAYVD